ncbi:MAG: acyltransferase [Pacificimonas sp.]
MATAPLTTRLDGIQALRGIAATMVVIYHAGGLVQSRTGMFDWQLSSGGWAGVDLFFVISGFIIMYIHGDKPGAATPRELRTYVWKRFRRVLPPYWVALAFTVAAYILVDSAGEDRWQNTGFMVENILLILPRVDGYLLGVAWTLPYEIMFYAIFGLFLWRPLFGMTAAAAWSLVAIYATLSQPFTPAGFFGMPFPLHFALGMICARTVLHGASERLRILLLPGCAILALGAYLPDLVRDEALFFVETPASRLLPAIGAFLIVLAVAGRDVEGGTTAGSVLHWTGDMSYSLYLVHFPVMAAAAMALDRMGIGNEWIFWPVLLSAAFSAGFLFFHIFERPLLKLKPPRLIPST